jgi:MYXO-CTERM domain-containing protein
MRRTLAAVVLVTGFAAAPTVAFAQTTNPDDSVVTSVVEQEVQTPVNSVVDTNDDDDDDGDKTGLWGLLGLLGLAGLAGLKRRRDNDQLGPRTGTVAADTQARGATRQD